MHLRRAGSFARLLQSSHLGVADGRSVLDILILCASLSAWLEIEAWGSRTSGTASRPLMHSSNQAEEDNSGIARQNSPNTSLTEDSHPGV